MILEFTYKNRIYEKLVSLLANKVQVKIINLREPHGERRYGN